MSLNLKLGKWYYGTIYLNHMYKWRGVFKYASNQVDGEKYLIGFKGKTKMYMAPDYKVYKLEDVKEITLEKALDKIK